MRTMASLVPQVGDAERNNGLICIIGYDSGRRCPPRETRRCLAASSHPSPCPTVCSPVHNLTRPTPFHPATTEAVAAANGVPALLRALSHQDPKPRVAVSSALFRAVASLATLQQLLTAPAAAAALAMAVKRSAFAEELCNMVRAVEAALGASRSAGLRASFTQLAVAAPDVLKAVVWQLGEYSRRLAMGAEAAMWSIGRHDAAAAGGAVADAATGYAAACANASALDGTSADAAAVEDGAANAATGSAAAGAAAGAVEDGLADAGEAVARVTGVSQKAIFDNAPPITGHTAAAVHDDADGTSDRFYGCEGDGIDLEGEGAAYFNTEATIRAEAAMSAASVMCLVTLEASESANPEPLIAVRAATLRPAARALCQIAQAAERFRRCAESLPAFEKHFFNAEVAGRLEAAMVSLIQVLTCLTNGNEMDGGAAALEAAEEAPGLEEVL